MTILDCWWIDDQWWRVRSQGWQRFYDEVVVNYDYAIQEKDDGVAEQTSASGCWTALHLDDQTACAAKLISQLGLFAELLSKKRRFAITVTSSCAEMSALVGEKLEKWIILFLFVLNTRKISLAQTHTHTHTCTHVHTQMLLQKGTSNHHRHCVTCDHAHNLVLIMTQWQHHDLPQSSRSRNNKPACNRCYERCSSLLWRRQFSIME